jgi:recyclin-1
MDKFKALEPVKLHQGSAIGPQGNAFWSASPFIGKLPSSLHSVILQYTPVPDVPAYARTNRALARLAASEELWKHNYSLLGVDRYGFGPVLDELESRARGGVTEQPPTLTVDVADDDFGDFTSGTDTFGLGFGGFPSQSGFSTSLSEVGNFIGSGTVMQDTNVLGPTSFRALYIRAHKLLRNLAPALLEPPHQILSSLFPHVTATASLLHRSKTLHLLHRFLFYLEPLRSSPSLLSALRAASDRFDATLLNAFDAADGRADEDGMHEAAEASWEIWDPHESRSGTVAEWEIGRVWAEKREIFYVTSAHKPLDNFTYVTRLVFPHYMKPWNNDTQPRGNLKFRADGRLHGLCLRRASGAWVPRCTRLPPGCRRSPVFCGSYCDGSSTSFNLMSTLLPCLSQKFTGFRIRHTSSHACPRSGEWRPVFESNRCMFSGSLAHCRYPS